MTRRQGTPRSPKPATRSVALVGLAVAVASVAMITAASAQRPRDVPRLIRDPKMAGPVPIPAAERDIPTVVAQKWLDVSDKGPTLEGATFDSHDNLIFCNVGDSQIIKATPSKAVSIMLAQPDLKAGGLAIDPTGRLVAASAGDMTRGTIGFVDPGAAALRPILRPEAGYVPNDLVFDKRGGFYFTDFKGSAVDPTGGVYYVAPDMHTVTPIVTHIALANGVALSPDGQFLWITEFGRNRLLKIALKDPTTVAPLGIAIAYHFIGPAPDSMRVDAQGNVYVALNGQGRVLILSPGGIPIGQILMPGRDEGHFLRTTSLALKPGSDEVYIVAAGGTASAVFRARTFVTAPSQHAAAD